jgi:hypothetical protein
MLPIMPQLYIAILRIFGNISQNEFFILSQFCVIGY